MSLGTLPWEASLPHCRLFCGLRCQSSDHPRSFSQLVFFCAESPFAWNSDRDPLNFWKGGTAGAHPPCVLGEIVLSQGSLPLNPGTWDLWGLIQSQLWGQGGIVNANIQNLGEKQTRSELLPLPRGLPSFQQGAA